LHCFDRYVDTVYASMWERGCNMADPQVIAAELDAAGLDSQAILATSQEPDVKERLLTNTQQAHARGAFGSPTFFIGQEMYFGKDRLHDMEEAILQTAGR
ncbi:MAG: DsbA family protein, partial [Giesbergeria sp.]|nr:DsbA family protein [Giesbergeria sp.]